MTEPIRVGMQTTDEVPVVDDFSPVSILDELKEELSQDVEVENLELAVPMRPTIRMVYRPVFDLDTLKKWRNASKEKRHKTNSEIDQKKFFYIVLAETCVGMQLFSKKQQKWVDITDPQTGTPWTFKSPGVSQYLKIVAPGWYAAVEKMYSNDGHIVITANTIMEKAGYGDYDYESGEDGPLEL